MDAAKDGVGHPVELPRHRAFSLRHHASSRKRRVCNHKPPAFNRRPHRYRAFNRRRLAFNRRLREFNRKRRELNLSDRSPRHPRREHCRSRLNPGSRRLRGFPTPSHSERSEYRSPTRLQTAPM